MIGCMLCGPLSDKYGRYRVFTSCVAAFTLLAFISPFSNSYWMFTILRFLTGKVKHILIKKKYIYSLDTEIYFQDTAFVIKQFLRYC